MSALRSVLIYVTMNTYEEYKEILNKCKTDDGIATDLVISVMTVCGTLSSHIDLLTVSNYEEEGFEMIYEPNKKSKIILKKNAKKIKSSFYNCLTILYNYVDSDNVKNKISSKIFPNGSIQFAGCRTIEAAYKAPVVLYNLISRIPNCVKEPTQFKLDNLRIVMINSNFDFKRSVLQERLKEKINEYKFDSNDDPNKVWRMATFQPEKYPGVNIRYWTENTRKIHKDDYLTQPLKINGQISIFVFRSGKASITGAKNIKDIKEAYDAITNLVRSNSEILLF